MARSQMKFSVDKMHVLSPEYKSIIGKNTADDWPGCYCPWWMICIIPCHPGVSCLKLSESSHSTSTVLSQLTNAGSFLNTMFLRTCFANWCSMIGILFFSKKSMLVICLLGMTQSFFRPSISAATIPITWRVPLPSMVRILWSTVVIGKKKCYVQQIYVIR